MRMAAVEKRGKNVEKTEVFRQTPALFAGKSDDFPRWVHQKLDLEIKFFPAYPASAVLESLSSMGAYRNGIYSPSTSPASLS